MRSYNTMIRSYHFFVLVVMALFSSCDALAKTKVPLLRRLRAFLPTNYPLALPWYENGLEFSCTGCGKCCRVDGDVWLAPEEVTSVMKHLGYNEVDEFRRKYIRGEISPEDGDHTQSWMCLKRNEGACVFLDPLGKCGIYDVRPVQCSTYPFWPSLLESEDDWIDESVLPDDVPLDNSLGDRYWSSELGGCEGIGFSTKIDKVNSMSGSESETKQPLDIIAREEITAKMKTAKNHWKRFPSQEIKESTWYL